MGAEAEVLAHAEAQMVIWGAVDPERVAVREDLFVAVGAGVEEGDWLGIRSTGLGRPAGSAESPMRSCACQPARASMGFAGPLF